MTAVLADVRLDPTRAVQATSPDGSSGIVPQLNQPALSQFLNPGLNQLEDVAPVGLGGFANTHLASMKSLHERASLRTKAQESLAALGTC